MTSSETPQWLPGAFARSMSNIGVDLDRAQLEELAGQLLAKWDSPNRHYHNVQHLVAVLSGIDELQGCTHDPDLLRVAVWLHGIVFVDYEDGDDARAVGEDEVASASAAAKILKATGLDESVVERICGLIISMKSHRSYPDDVDQQVLLDADMSMLAADPQDYRDYVAAVREEYAHVPEAAYCRFRRRIVRKLLGRNAIFNSPMAEDWDSVARNNLEAEKARLDTELSSLESDVRREANDAAEEHDEAIERYQHRSDDPSTGVIKGMAPLKSASEPQVITAELPVIKAEEDSEEQPQMAPDEGALEEKANQDQDLEEEQAEQEDLSSSLELAIDVLDSLPKREEKPKESAAGTD
ncbi:MAG: hypothetical protein E6631_00680 [Winkia neuii]|nr:hypothetical protein [Winkia neuii]